MQKTTKQMLILDLKVINNICLNFSNPSDLISVYTSLVYYKGFNIDDSSEFIRISYGWKQSRLDKCIGRLKAMGVKFDKKNNIKGS